MFPVDTARQTALAQALANAGANVVCRQIGNLAHVYAAEANGEIIDWMSRTAEPRHGQRLWVSPVQRRVLGSRL